MQRGRVREIQMNRMDSMTSYRVRLQSCWLGCFLWILPMAFAGTSMQAQQQASPPDTQAKPVQVATPVRIGVLARYRVD